MFPCCYENVAGVDFESDKASAREGFLDSVLRLNYFLGALCYAGSCGWVHLTALAGAASV